MRLGPGELVALGAGVGLGFGRAQQRDVLGDLAVLGAVIISVAVFGVTGAGLGTLLGSEVVTIAGLLLYLYVAEPLLSRITALGSVTAYLPGVAADGLTEAGVRVLPPWQGGLVFTA